MIHLNDLINMLLYIPLLGFTVQGVITRCFFVYEPMSDYLPLRMNIQLKEIFFLIRNQRVTDLPNIGSRRILRRCGL